MTSQPRAAALECYLRTNAVGVEGWLAKRSARLIAELGRFQVERGMEGAIGEIGVHHGRLFILLQLGARPGDKSIAIDVFENQDLNVDGSGKGDRAMFERNLRHYGLDPAETTIWTRSSLEVTAPEILSAVGPLRLFSIDGGHTVECIINDMRLAEAALAPHGVAIVDDVFNSTWPSVIDGFVQYLSASPGLIPFATSPNKVYACPPQSVDLYRGHLRHAFGHLFDRTGEFLGFQMDGYGDWTRVGMKEQVLDHLRIKLYRDFGWGGPARQR